MSEAKFTPGPWHPGCFVKGETGCQCRYVLDEGHAGGIATVHMHNGIDLVSDGGNDAPKREQAVANCHLIAAAPELYEALDRAEAVLSIVEPRSHKVEYLDTLDEVRAVLRLARGEE